MAKKYNVLYVREVAREMERVLEKDENSSIYWAVVCGKETSFGRPVKVWPKKFNPTYKMTDECGEGVRVIISDGGDDLIIVKLLTDMKKALEVDLPSIVNFINGVDYEKLMLNQ